jgi:hypothetical protein
MNLGEAKKGALVRHAVGLYLVHDSANPVNGIISATNIKDGLTVYFHETTPVELVAENLFMDINSLLATVSAKELMRVRDILQENQGDLYQERNEHNKLRREVRELGGLEGIRNSVRVTDALDELKESLNDY